MTSLAIVLCRIGCSHWQAGQFEDCLQQMKTMVTDIPILLAQLAVSPVSAVFLVLQLVAEQNQTCIFILLLLVDCCFRHPPPLPLGHELAATKALQ